MALLADGRRRSAFADWLKNDLPARFSGRVLKINQEIAEAWGDLMAESFRRGIGTSIMDGFIAATAIAGEFELVTRNTKDFARFGVSLFNPWDYQSERER